MASKVWFIFGVDVDDANAAAYKDFDFYVVAAGVADAADAAAAAAADAADIDDADVNGSYVDGAAAVVADAADCK